MKQVLIYNQDNPELKPVQARYCASFACRLRGLTFQRKPAPHRGLLLVQARESRVDAAIHMLGVWMDLTAVWINERVEVVDVQLVRAWRPFYVPALPARYILELAAEHQADFKVGDRLKFEEVALG
ncbi:MAG: DUF192 domain-containing protein [Anaerolineales bacterium]|nr:MAG: DUF192 domain-containing protein [Anaerolineales bacterium]